MEVIKCRLCKEEIEYSQRCRVYIKTDELRPYQRISKRPHIGRFKLISTAKSTEHISFARRLKRLRTIKDNIESSYNSRNSHKVDQKTKQPWENKDNPQEPPCTEESEPEKNRGPAFTEKTERRYKRLNKKESESSSRKTKEKLWVYELSANTIAYESDSSINTSCERKSLDKDSEFPRKIVREELTEISVIKSEPFKKEPSPKNFVESKAAKPRNIENFLSRKEPSRNNMSHPHFQSSFEEYIKPSLSKNNSTFYVTKETKRKNFELNAEFDKKKMQVTSKSINNGTIRDSKNSDCETYFWLEMPKPKLSELRKLGYDFENLVTEVKHMKLPNPDWKIKIMVHKQEMVSVSFTKKLFPEKVVSVNAKSLVCDITIDGKKIILLGSPIYIHSIKDLEIMLDIVNDIEPDSPMITYLKSVV